jgi:hypothetical protein
MPAIHGVRTTVCILFMLRVGSVAAQAQPDTPFPGSRQPTQLQAGIGVQAAAPVGDFGTHVEAAGGVLAHLDAGLARSVFSVGGEIAYLIYGDESREVALGSLIPDIPAASVKVNTENAMVLLHARLRAQRRAGRWRPYVDSLFGFNSLFTTTSIECSDSSCESSVAEATNSRDFVLSYGGGAGIMIGFRPSPRSLRLDLSARYLRGGEAQYLIEGAIHRENGQAILNFSRSRTDMIAFYVGIAAGR